MSEERLEESMIPVGRRFYNHTYEDEDSYQKIQAGMARLLRSNPFWGVIAIKLVRVEDTSGFIGTMATDGMHLFYSAKFVQKLDMLQIEFAIAHEIMHCMLEHVLEERRGKRDRKLWNFATDFHINAELYHAGIGVHPSDDKKGLDALLPKLLYDPKFLGWSSERIYNELMNDSHEKIQGGGMPFDTHLTTSCVGETSPDVEMSGEEQDQMKKNWTYYAQEAEDAHYEAINHGMKGIGDIPAGIRRYLNELRKPKVNWKGVLRRFVDRIMAHRYSLNQPKKSYFNSGFTLPSLRKPQEILKIAVLIDTSGSVTQEELTVFVSEILGILNRFDRYEIHAMCFDCGPVEGSYKVIKRGQGQNFKDMEKFINSVSGGGGTNPLPCWHFLRDKKVDIRAVVTLTDGGIHPTSWGISNSYPALFLVTDPDIKAPFGNTIHYDANV